MADIFPARKQLQDLSPNIVWHKAQLSNKIQKITPSFTSGDGHGFFVGLSHSIEPMIQCCTKYCKSTLNIHTLKNISLH